MQEAKHRQREDEGFFYYWSWTLNLKAAPKALTLLSDHSGKNDLLSGGKRSWLMYSGVKTPHSKVWRFMLRVLVEAKKWDQTTLELFAGWSASITITH